MDHVARERDEDVIPDVRRPEPPAPQPVQAGSMAWASAVGNQAVQRLARQELESAEAMPAEAEVAEVEAEPEEEAVPPEVEAMQAEGFGMDAVAGLDAVDELGEDALPE